MSKYTIEIEKDILDNWKKNNPFKIEVNEKEPYSILMPPPNITGVLHLGHVLNNTLQDILIRYYRNKGYNSCWFAGIDHASIATEAKVCAWLKEKNIDKNSLSKEEFLKYCWEWKEEYGSIIIEQLKRCGFSFDYERINFTMDKAHYDLVISTYKTLKEKGFIYKEMKKLPFDKMANTFVSESETYEKNGKIYSERTNCLIEYRESEQIFLKMSELAKPALDKIFSEIEMTPKNSFNAYKHWFDELQDWCISRQLSWGQSIPDEEGMVFDTWFSSWLWAISCFTEEEYKYFSPSNVIITGEDISFFWIAKMIMCNDFLKQDVPFKNIYFTGIMRDEKGRKFSKQLNNSPDILKLIDEHGADNLRFSTIIDHQAGLDCKWSIDKVIQGKKFCNKIWNINKLINDVWKSNENTLMTENQKELYMKFIHTLNSKVEEYNKLVESHKFSDALLLIYNLLWEDFSSQLLEFIKPDKENFPYLNKELYDNIKEDFVNMLYMLEPFMPFISNHMISKNSIC